MDIIILVIFLLIMLSILGYPFFIEYIEDKKKAKEMEEKSKIEKEYEKQRREDLKLFYKKQISELNIDDVITGDEIKFKEDEKILIKISNNFPHYKKKNKDDSCGFGPPFYIITDHQLIICSVYNSEAFSHHDFEKVIIDVDYIEIRLKEKYEYIKIFMPIDDIVKFEIFMKNRHIPYAPLIDN